jgi:anti-sigma B factor antagonist
MKISEERHGDVAILQIDGGLGYENHRDFAEMVDRALHEGVRHIIFDMDRLVYLSSWGIGSVLAATARVRQNGGKAVLANVKRDLFHTLRIMRLVHILEIRDSVEDALEAVSPGTTSLP